MYLKIYVLINIITFICLLRALWIINHLIDKIKIKHDLSGYEISVLGLALSQIAFWKFQSNDNSPYEYNIYIIMFMSFMLLMIFLCIIRNKYIRYGRYSINPYSLQYSIYKIILNIISVYGILFAGILNLNDVTNNGSNSFIYLLYSMFLIIAAFLDIAFNANIFNHEVTNIKEKSSYTIIYIPADLLNKDRSLRVKIAVKSYLPSCPKIIIV